MSDSLPHCCADLFLQLHLIHPQRHEGVWDSHLVNKASRGETLWSWYEWNGAQKRSLQSSHLPYVTLLTQQNLERESGVGMGLPAPALTLLPYIKDRPNSVSFTRWSLHSPGWKFLDNSPTREFIYTGTEWGKWSACYMGKHMGTSSALVTRLPVRMTRPLKI